MLMTKLQYLHKQFNFPLDFDIIIEETVQGSPAAMKIYTGAPK